MDKTRKKPTKERIIEIALKLFSENGFDNVTINDICEGSGITKSTFYYHFDSKDAILHNFIDYSNAYIEENFNKLLTSSNYVEQLWTFYLLATEPTCKVGVEIAKQIMISNLHKDHGLYTPGEYKEWETEKLLIQKAQENGQIVNTAPAEKIAEALVFAMEGVSMVWCINKGQFDLIRKIREVFDTILMVTPNFRAEE